eukprot:641237-Amphidinium_carterae.1
MIDHFAHIHISSQTFAFSKLILSYIVTGPSSTFGDNESIAKRFIQTRHMTTVMAIDNIRKG